MRESELYAPVKAMLQAQGYEVKAEIGDCDLMALRGDDAPVIVELKLRMSLALVLQGIDRQAVTDAVYIAVARGSGARWRARLGDMLRLCRRLGLGLITVRLSKTPAVEVHADPAPYRPRPSAPRRAALLREFARRVGDPNTGGQTRRPVVTAYRQDALRLARRIEAEGTGRGADLARRLSVPNAAAILQKDHYGWFERVKRGVYRLSPRGCEALVLYRDLSL